MIKTISNWWNRDKIALQTQINELITKRRLDDEERVRVKLEEEAAAEEKRIADEAEAEEKRKAAEAAADKHNSTDPWVEITGDRIDPIRGLVIELDWNDAFIQYLKENGITARDPETSVQKWVALLYQNIVGEMEAIAIDRSDNMREGDFE